MLSDGDHRLVWRLVADSLGSGNELAAATVWPLAFRQSPDRALNRGSLAMGTNQSDPPQHAVDHNESGMLGPPRLIVVDDEPELREILVEYLTKHGFAVRTAASGQELDARLAVEPADLLILDITMPGEDGLSIARRIRARGTTPILMLTAADDVVDRVVGLEVGADDYVTKPFDLRELRARIRALMRRAEPAPVGPPPAPPSAADGLSAADRPPVADGIKRVRFGKVLLDMQARCLLGDDGEALPLTSMEFDLLRAFAQNPNRVLTRDRLLDLAHNRGWEPFDRSIDIRIARLRRKIEPDPGKPQVIKTVHGTGYVFVMKP
jgi:two-component system OmpR family response regulator